MDGPDSMELVTAGKYGVSADEIRLTWEESELTGMEGTHTSLTVQPGSVVLSREGTMNTSMEFEEGKKHYFLYETPFGELPVDIQTSMLRHNLSQRGGLMEIKYSIAVAHTVTGRNCFKIQAKRKH